MESNNHFSERRGERKEERKADTQSRSGRSRSASSRAAASGVSAMVLRRQDEAQQIFQSLRECTREVVKIDSNLTTAGLGSLPKIKWTTYSRINGAALPTPMLRLAGLRLRPATTPTTPFVETALIHELLPVAIPLDSVNIQEMRMPYTGEAKVEAEDIGICFERNAYDARGVKQSAKQVVNSTRYQMDTFTAVKEEEEEEKNSDDEYGYGDANTNQPKRTRKTQGRKAEVERKAQAAIAKAKEAKE